MRFIFAILLSIFMCTVVLSQQVEKNIFVDFGPNDITNGNITVSPDTNGNYWNNVVEGAIDSVTGPFVDVNNDTTGISLIMTSVMFKNGILNGGLLSPDSVLLGEFAIPTATQDYFYKDSPNGSGSFTLFGLDTSKQYVFHFFATRNTTQDRITQYDIQGSNSTSLTLQTSGTDLGGPGYNGNNSTIAVSDTISPDVNREISITVSTVSGGFCYIGILKVEVIQPKVPFESLLVDFGPNDVTNGNITVNPDTNGNYWNNVIETTVGSNPVQFVDINNNPTGVALTITAAFASNGIQNGGLLDPDSSLLGEFAIPTATQDYFYRYADQVGEFSLSGLDLSKAYKFSFFGTRNSTETRITQYIVSGGASDTTTLLTSGTDLGGPGYNGNNSTIAVSQPVHPDANGNITVSVTRVAGTFSYIGIMKVEEIEPAPPVTSTGIFLDFGPNDITNGNITVSPDTNGNYWNNVIHGSVDSVSGPFVDNANNATSISLRMTSVLFSNGILNGGLLSPDSSLLGEFAIPTATQDYFYKDWANGSGGFTLSGLDTSKQYVFHIFATRNTTQDRITQYDIQGKNSTSITLQTSGTDLGGPGYNGNNSTIAVSDPVLPDVNGEISFTISIVTGGFSYIGIMKIEPQEIVEKLALENAGFESGDLSSWSIDPQGSSASAEVNSEYMHSGSYALKLLGDSVKVVQSISCTPGNDYKLFGFSYVSSTNSLLSGQSAVLNLNYYNDSYTLLEQTSSELITSSSTMDEWNKISILATAPENAHHAEAVISWNGITGQPNGAVYFDDFDLVVYDETVSPCTSYPQVVNERNTSIYMDTTYNDSTWFVIDLPADTNNVLRGNRTYWFRKVVNVSPAFATDSMFAVQFTNLDASLAVWVNGVLVGESGFTNVGRTYIVDDSLVHTGENLIVIQTGFLKGSSFFDDLSIMKLFSPSLDIFISGEWRYKQGIIFSNDNIVHDDYKIAVMGSSVALGYGASNYNGYASQYSTLLHNRFLNNIGADWEVVNISIGGNNTVDVLNRFDSDLIPQCAKYVVYGLSLGNEGIHEYGQTAFDQFRDNMQMLIQRARDNGITPVVVNCYTRNDFTATDYDFIKQMNLLIHSWDVPSINVLGAVDDGAGRWVPGYYADGWHPNDAGHREMYYTMVPSLFDALDQGKPMPQKVDSTFYTIANPDTISPLEYEIDEIVHSFTFSFDFRTSYSGAVAAFCDYSGYGLIEIDSLTGTVNYTSPADSEVTSTVSVTDNVWHKITLSHYFARAVTFLYVDTIQVGTVAEHLIPQKFVLGGSGFFENIAAPQQADYRDWLFYRSALNQDEVNALCSGELLQSSLELYAPLDGEGTTGTDPFINLAQSLTTVTQNNLVGVIDGKESIPQKFGLYQNYPNPFNPTTTIKYAIAKTTDVKIYIYNILGQQVGVLLDKKQIPGYYKVSFENRHLASGLYFYTLVAGNFRQTKKMMLLK